MCAVCRCESIPLDVVSNPFHFIHIQRHNIALDYNIDLPLTSVNISHYVRFYYLLSLSCIAVDCKVHGIWLRLLKYHLSHRPASYRLLFSPSVSAQVQCSPVAAELRPRSNPPLKPRLSVGLSEIWGLLTSHVSTQHSSRCQPRKFSISRKTSWFQYLHLLPYELVRFLPILHNNCK